MLIFLATVWCLISFSQAQYEDNNADSILPYQPPGYMPPMPPLDPPGYDGALTEEQPTPTTGLRAPPIPTWTQEIPLESSAEIPKIEDSLNTDDTPVDVESSGDASGFGEGSGDFFEASGEGADEDNLPNIMKQLDGEAAALGVDCPSDTVFIIDATSSVRGVFEEYIKFVEKVIEGLDIQPSVDHVGAIIYSSEKKQRMKIQLGEHEDMGSLMKAVDELPFFSGITATGQALQFAANHTEGRRDNLILNFVVLTDGYSYDLIEKGAKLLQSVPNSRVYAVSIGDIYIRKELEMIVGNPDNVLIGAMSYGTLVKRIKLCEARERVLAQKDTNPLLVRPGEFMSDRHQQRSGLIAGVDLKAATEGFVKHPAEQIPVKDCKYDIGIIFDSSGSLIKNFQKQLSFANQLVSQLPISENATRVGIVQFAGRTKTKVLADFNQSKTGAQLKKIIDSCSFYSGTTFTNQALMKMAKLFEDSKRADAKYKLLIFTDGYSAEDTSEGIQALKNQGITIFTVGISTDKVAGLNMHELRGMATSPEHYFDSSDFPELLRNFPSSQYC